MVPRAGCLKDAQHEPRPASPVPNPGLPYKPWRAVELPARGT